MSADHGVYCEICGTHIDLFDGSPVRVCPGCRVVVGQECWNPAHSRCTACASAATAHGHPKRRHSGLAAMREILQQLNVLRADAEALATASSAGVARRGADPDLDLTLLRACAATLRADASQAAADASPRSAAKLAELTRQQDEALSAIERALSDIQVHRDGARVVEGADGTSRGRPSWEWLVEYRSRLVRVGVGIAAIILVAVVVQRIPAFTGIPASTPPVDSRESDRDGVLGGNPSPSPSSDAGPLAGSAPTLITFDELRMNAPIPPEWRVERGAQEQVSVAANPSAVDRSLELRASTTGAGLTLCRWLPGHASGFGLDVMVATPGAAVQLALPADAEDPTQPAWLLSAGTAPETAPATALPVTAGAWYRFDAVIQPGETGVTWRFLEGGGTSSSSTLIDEGDVDLTNPVGSVCVSLLDGEQGSRAFIDDLTFSRSY
jgi:hypothetical protein